ncbi:MAG: hypothetical protein Q9216_004485, partial [Gyalolechia sp. 2 TL-2023]
MKTPNHIAPLPDISLIAIVISWVLTAFLPIPLIISLITLRYFPGAISQLLSRYPLRSRRLAEKQSGSSLGDHATSTPTLHTLSVSETSSQTLPVSHNSPATPPKHGISEQDYASPRTSQSPSANNLGASRTPSESNTKPISASTIQREEEVNSSSIEQPSSAFNGPRGLSFLEPLNLPSTPRRQAYTRLSPGNPTKPSATDPLAASRPLQRRRLKRRFVVSTVYLALILAMYVLEGFAIAAAHSYAHVRVLSKVGGKGGLGTGKEDERWLIPWVIYIFVQGSLIVGCGWMVWGIKKEMELSNQESTQRKGKTFENSDTASSRKNEQQAIKTEGETERFLPEAEQGLAEARQGTENAENDEAEGQNEPESQNTGYHPIFDSFRTSAGSDSPNPNPSPASSQPFKPASSPFNPRGEGSSRDSNSNKPSPFPTSSLPLARLPEKIGSWWTERSNTEPKPQQPTSNLYKWGWGSEPEDPNREAEELLGQTTGEEDRHNSWALDEAGGSERVEGKGKGKGKEGDEELNAGIELTTHVPRELVTGINLGKQYHFTDGLAYPLLPLPPRRVKNPGEVYNGG